MFPGLARPRSGAVDGEILLPRRDGLLAQAEPFEDQGAIE